MTSMKRNADDTAELEVENIVASGKLQRDFELSVLAKDLSSISAHIDSVEHSRRRGNRLLIHFPGTETLGIFAPTGVFVFTGSDDYGQVWKSYDHLIAALAELDILPKEPEEEHFTEPLTTRNVVCTADLGDSINLDSLAIGLGLELTEYEPEQFPGLVYRPSESNVTILIFASGKAVLTGLADERDAEIEFQNLKDKIASVMP